MSFDSGFFVLVFEPEHNILWCTKKESAFFTYFSVKLPLSIGGSCGIMTVTDEIGRGSV